MKSMDEKELQLDKVVFVAKKVNQLVERGMTIKNACNQAFLYLNLIEDPFAVNYIIFKEDELASNYFSEDIVANTKAEYMSYPDPEIFEILENHKKETESLNDENWEKLYNYILSAKLAKIVNNKENEING
jgi:hypothetical protein